MPRGCVRAEPAFRIRPQVFAWSRHTSEARHDDAIVSERTPSGARHRNLEEGAAPPSSISHRSAAYRLPPSLIDRLSTTRRSPAALLAMRIASRRSHSLLTNPCSTTAPFSTDTVTCSS
jgi:hypothetical protein